MNSQPLVHRFVRALFGFAVALALLIPAMTSRAAAQLGQAEASPADPFVGKALDNLELVYEIDEDGDYKMLFELDGDRSQLVYVFSAVETFGALRIREVWAPVAKPKNLTASVAKKLLAENQSVKFGAFRVLDSANDEGEPAILIAFAAHISADTTGDALMSALEMVYSQADEMEAELTAADDF